MTIIIVKEGFLLNLKNKNIYYSIAEAKAKFSKAIDESRENNVIITKNGKPVSVIIDFDKFEKIVNFLENVWELYLLEIGDPSKFKDLNINDLFSDND